MLFHLLYNDYVASNFQESSGYDDEVTQFYLNFLRFPRLECDAYPLQSIIKTRTFICKKVEFRDYEGRCFTVFLGKAPRSPILNMIAMADSYYSHGFWFHWRTFVTCKGFQLWSRFLQIPPPSPDHIQLYTVLLFNCKCSQ